MSYQDYANIISSYDNKANARREASEGRYANFSSGFRERGLAALQQAEDLANEKSNQLIAKAQTSALKALGLEEADRQKAESIATTGIIAAPIIDKLLQAKRAKVDKSGKVIKSTETTQGGPTKMEQIDQKLKNAKEMRDKADARRRVNTREGRGTEMKEARERVQPPEQNIEPGRAIGEDAGQELVGQEAIDLEEALPQLIKENEARRAIQREGGSTEMNIMREGTSGAGGSRPRSGRRGFGNQKSATDTSARGVDISIKNDNLDILRPPTSEGAGSSTDPLPTQSAPPTQPRPQEAPMPKTTIDKSVPELSPDIAPETRVLTRAAEREVQAAATNIAAPEAASNIATQQAAETAGRVAEQTAAETAGEAIGASQALDEIPGLGQITALAGGIYALGEGLHWWGGGDDKTPIPTKPTISTFQTSGTISKPTFNTMSRALATPTINSGIMR